MRIAADKDAIEAARAAYEALSDEQKKEVPPETLKKLTDAEDQLVKVYPKALDDAKDNAKDGLDDMKSDKNQSDYDPKDWEAMTKAIEDGKAAIDKADTIKDVEAAKKDAADAVSKIKTKTEKLQDAKDKIGNLPAKDDVQPTDRQAIKAARAAY